MTKPGASEIATHLRQDITRGDLKKEDRIPSERILADNFGVARNTVREALSRLEADGYVQTRPGSGTYVTYQPPADAANAIADASPLELVDARFALEPHICRLGVLHGRKQDFDELDALCRQMDDANGDPVAFALADALFHRKLAETTGNTLLIWIIGQINAVRSRDEWTRMTRLTLDDQTIAHYIREHRQILNAIRMREPEHAANQMKAHLETARLSLTRAAQA